jgi:hypothetical protein
MSVGLPPFMYLLGELKPVLELVDDNDKIVKSA